MKKPEHVDLTKSRTSVIVIPNSDERTPSPKKRKTSSTPFQSLSSDNEMKGFKISSTNTKRNLMEFFGTEHQDREYFMVDKTLPIHTKGVRSGVFIRDILNEMLAHKRAMATRVHLGVNMNALFFIGTKN